MHSDLSNVRIDHVRKTSDLINQVSSTIDVNSGEVKSSFAPKNYVTEDDDVKMSQFKLVSWNQLAPGTDGKTLSPELH